jgi:methylglutaconyl-CoA hydratase
VNLTTLELTVEGGIAQVWLNRPEVRNAFNEAMITELTQVFANLGVREDVRAVVLAAHGKAFCAGADLNWMKEMAGYSLAENQQDAMGLATMLRTLHECPKPTIARVHGDAFAGGIGLLSACDMAVAAQTANFCLSESRLGLVPATIAPYVIRAMGPRHAHRYFLTAERFTAAEAFRIGLVQQQCLDADLNDMVNLWLEHLLNASPNAIAEGKALLRSVSHAAIDDALVADTAERIARVRASAEGREGVQAFLNKRPPAWVPPVPPPDADDA